MTSPKPVSKSARWGASLEFSWNVLYPPHSRRCSHSGSGRGSEVPGSVRWSKQGYKHAKCENECWNDCSINRTNNISPFDQCAHYRTSIKYFKQPFKTKNTSNHASEPYTPPCEPQVRSVSFQRTLGVAPQRADLGTDLGDGIWVRQSVFYDYVKLSADVHPLKQSLRTSKCHNF